MLPSLISASANSLRPRQAAGFLCIGISTFWLWVKTRPDFPAVYKVGRGVSLVDGAALLAWRDAQVKVKVKS